MKKLAIVCALLAAGPAFAQSQNQNSFTTTQNPPAGGSSESTAQPTTSLPRSSGTEQPTVQPGSNVGTTVTQPTPGTTTTPAPTR